MGREGPKSLIFPSFIYGILSKKKELKEANKHLTKPMKMVYYKMKEKVKNEGEDADEPVLDLVPIATPAADQMLQQPVQQTRI